MKNQSKLLVIFTILLIAIPFLSAETFTPEDQCTWWDYILDIFREYNCGETIEYETPYNETIEEPIPEEPIPEEYDNSENIYDIKGYRFENYRIIQTGEEYQYDVVMEKDIKNGKLKIKVQKDYKAKSILPKVLILQDEKGNILSSANLTIKGNKYEYNFDYDKPKKKAKIGKNSITIIKISDAEYLDSSRDLVENIYDYVKAEDNIIYSATNGNYIRVNFEQQLKNGNDISLYASGSGSIEIYKEGTNDLVGTISGISSYKKYSTLLSNVGERTDTFDLKIIGNVDVDYIVDPTGYFTFQIETTENNQNFTFQTDNAADLLILWGDGTNETVSGTGLRSHSYSTAGTYNISLNGQAIRIAFGSSSTTPTLLKDILTNMSDGLTGITSGYQMFKGCTNITTFTESAFFDDVSGSVTNLNGMFYGASAFNQPIGSWDTSKVTTMANMFSGASSFNGNISSWDTSSVTTMANMFQGATAFNQPIGNWNTSSVTLMNGMFNGATSFNQNISSWDTSSVTLMQNMFQRATVFNQPLNNWDTSKVTSIGFMFSEASNFNGNISSWNTSNLRSLYSTFQRAYAFNQSLDNWDVSNVTTMNRAFEFARTFNQPLNSWNTSSVTDMERTFSYSQNFSQDLNDWDTSKVTNMISMFQGASSFNQDISNWNTSSVTNMQQMFFGATSFNQPLNNWNTSSVTTMQQVFQSATNFNGNISTWDTSKVTRMDDMFYLATSFNQPIGSWNTSSVNTMYEMFSSAAIFNQNLSSWDTRNVVNMQSMFNNAYAFNGSLSGWNTSNVTTMRAMFTNSKFNQPIGNWDTSKVTNMQGMFYQATNFNQDLSSWDTSKVTTMASIFQSAVNFNQPIVNWDVSNVTTFAGMFKSATSFNQPLNSWNTSKATLMSEMFYLASKFNQPLNNWDTSKVENMYAMFHTASSFNQDLGNWNVSSVTGNSLNYFLYASNLSVVNYDSILNNWSKLTLQNGVAFSVGATKYSKLSNSSREILRTTYGWTITDGGLYTDTTAPTITINSPENQTYTTKLISINIDAVDDTYLDSVWYDIGEGNTTYTAPFIETFDSGNYTLIAYVNDTYGNLNSTNVSFVVDMGCIESLVNTSKTSWVDTTSCIDGLVNQSRNWTQYDYNDCGEVANETFFEYRTTSCGGTVLTAPTISLLNCRIPNTNPLCWFYSFGMSLISKNIILINGGILNII